MKYESPIDIIANVDFDHKILKAIQSYGIVVEKDELIKALEYDRHQYEKGYADAMAERKTGRWIKLDKDNKLFVPHILECSECGNILDKHGVNAGRGDANYCPNCGARMTE